MTTVKDYVGKQGLSTLQRPRYSTGMLLEDEDLTAAVAYPREMIRLLFRSLFGCGVICGLDVKAKLTCNRMRVTVSVSRGVALDCMANPIHLPREDTIEFDADCAPPPVTLWVAVCHYEKCCRPRDMSCAADDEGQRAHTRSQEGYEIRLYSKRPHCACTCEPPAPDDEQRDPGGRCCSEPAPAPVPTPTPAPTLAPTGTGTTPGAGPGTTPAGAPGRPSGVNVLAENGTGRTQPRAQEPQPLQPCACFADHYAGKCGCDCGCSCVVIGKVLPTQLIDKDGKPVDQSDEPDPSVAVDTSVVRWIRPALTGYWKCLDTPKGAPLTQPATPNQPAAGSVR